MKKKEIVDVQLSFKKYLVDDIPVCSISTEENCEFLRTSGFGTHFDCNYTDEVVFYGENGFLNVCDECPLNTKN